MRILLGALALALAAPVVGPPAQADSLRHLDWQEQVVDAGQSFRGLDAVDRRTAWISGGSVTAGGPGKVWRTTDGGTTWNDVSPPDSEGLLFRDVEARSADVALVLAIGAGEASRIYRTTDGGETWTETFRNQDEAAFYNCMDFFPRRPPWARGQRPGRRQVPDPQHRRRRPLVGGAAHRRHARLHRGGQLRRQR